MSREKKSKVDDLLKLRRILDNSSDPALNSLLTKDDIALESIRRRLSGISSPTQRTFTHAHLGFTSMEPRVFIHEKIPSSPPCSVSLRPRVESSVPLPEFTVVSVSPSTTQTPPPEIPFDTEDLFEVEKVERSVLEFIEVAPKQPMQLFQEKEITMQYDRAPTQDPSLPEWQPVTDGPERTIQESYEQQKAENTPEFEQVSIFPASESLEEEPVIRKEEQPETSVDFLPVEPSESSYKMLTRQQIRGLKRAQRKKEKEAKKLQRIEQKRLKRERRQQDNEEEQTMKQQPPLQESQEEQPIHLETFEPVESPQQKRYREDFKGIECIDEKTAELLYKNGYFSIENLEDATIDDLVQIRGIKRKLAKQIKKEIEQNSTLPDTDEFVPMKQTLAKKKSAKKLKDTAEWESYTVEKKITKQASPAVCTYKEYTLYKKVSSLNKGKKTTIHFFSKEKPRNGQPTQLPEGCRITINKKTGVPYLKKKR